MEAWIILIVIVLFLAWRMMSSKGIKTISTEELKTMLNNHEKIFIDVRTPQEFQARHIKQFQNIPLGSDLSRLPKDKEIVVICQSGMRSLQACKQLKKLGYKYVTNVRGGMNAYKEEKR